jgi:hypothetical protein
MSIKLLIMVKSRKTGSNFTDLDSDSRFCQIFWHFVILLQLAKYDIHFTDNTLVSLQECLSDFSPAEKENCTLSVNSGRWLY